MNHSSLPLAAALACSVAHCIPSEGGFRDLDRMVADRLGPDVHAPRAHANDSGDLDPTLRARLAHPLDAEAAMRIALANNRDLRASLASLGVAAGVLLQASLLPNPTGGLSYRFPLSPGAQSVGAVWDADAVIDVRALLLLPAGRQAASAEFEATRYGVAARTVDVAYAARVALYRYQAAAQQVEMLRTALEATTAGLAVARALTEAGNLPSLDLAQQQVLYEDTRIQLATAENEQHQAHERVNVALGLWGGDVQWQAEPRLADVPSTESGIDHVESDAVDRSLVLEAGLRRIEASRARLGLARAAGWLPQLEAGVAVAREEGHDFAGPSVRIGVPLFNQGQGMATVRTAELQRDEAQYVATAVRLRSVVRVAREQLMFSRAQVEWYRTVQLPLRERIVEQSQLQYNAMQLGVFQLIQARREEIRAGRGYIDALRTYWVARANLSRLLAGGSPDEAMGSDASSVQPIEGSL